MIFNAGVPNPVISAMLEKVRGETAEEIYESLLTDLSLFELQELMQWYEIE